MRVTWAGRQRRGHTGTGREGTGQDRTRCLFTEPLLKPFLRNGARQKRNALSLPRREMALCLYSTPPAAVTWEFGCTAAAVTQQVWNRPSVGSGSY